MTAARVGEAKLPGVKRSYLDSRYGQIHYRSARPPEAARNPTLLCLHQTPKSGGDYEPLMPRLARNRIVIAPDTPGYGASDPPPAPIAIEDYATLMIRFIGDLQENGLAPHGPIDVIGYHTGSVIATQMALAAPERIRKLVLVSLPAFTADERLRRLETIDRFPTPQADGSHLKAMWDISQALNDERLSVESRHLTVAECFRPGSRMPWGFMAVYKYDFRTALTALRHETLVLNPEDELFELTRNTVSLIADSSLYEFRNAGNGFLEADSEHVCTVVREFLDAAALTVRTTRCK